jgi:hypothetical protein
MIYRARSRGSGGFATALLESAATILPSGSGTVGSVVSIQIQLSQARQVRSRTFGFVGYDNG